MRSASKRLFKGARKVTYAALSLSCHDGQSEVRREAAPANLGCATPPVDLDERPDQMENWGRHDPVGHRQVSGSVCFRTIAGVCLRGRAELQCSI
jgi:hypothetical protein